LTAWTHRAAGPPNLGHPAKEQRIGLLDVFHRVTMQVFVRWNDTMIAAPV
jgi:hypothetical protein